MKLDDNYEPNRRGEAREGNKQPGEGSAPLADREVPLAPAVATMDHIHRWLDGEAPEPTGLRADQTRSIDFWRRMDEETERRRRLVTPPYVAARIMASLPETRTATVMAPWWKKDVHLSPATIVALAIGAFSLGLLAMRLIAS